MSEQINNGGSAFPVQDAASWQAHGMTLRDYFAAHAPKKPAFWFAPKAKTNPAWSERSPHKLPHGASAAVGHCPACDEYFVKQAKYEADRKRRESEYQIARHVEWPWAYADAMLAARGDA